MKTIKCRCGRDILLEDSVFNLVKDKTINCSNRQTVVSIFKNWNRYTLSELTLQPKVGYLIDHIDRNSHNNLLSNLRYASYMQNAHNRSKLSTVEYKGIHYRKDNKTWRARIVLCGKRLNLGQFQTKEEAASAYNKAALELHKEFAVTNLAAA